MSRTQREQPRSWRRGRSCCAKRAGTRGLTLLELIVVLVILAALGTVMITQTAGLTGEARYEQTVRTLEQLEDAVVGRQPVGSEDPTAVLPGFVSDMGRLPESEAVTVGGGTVFTLAELWDSTLYEADDLFFRPRQLTGLDEGLEMFSGWRGPYVRLPIGSGALNDGWGAGFDLEDVDGADVTAGDVAIGAFRSDGSGLGDDFDPAAPLEVVLVDTTQGIDRSTGSLPMDSLTVDYIVPATGTGGAINGVVRLYGIVDGLPALLLQSDVFAVTGTAGTTTSVAVVFDDPDAPGTPLSSFSAVVGPKVLRAYVITGPAAPPTDPLDPLADLTAEDKSAPLRFTLPAGGLGLLPTPIRLEGS
ncbi:MAG: prepilin-type N-terminal cleavage/methylation domain-containing protein [Planctomycetota bacterium]